MVIVLKTFYIFKLNREYFLLAKKNLNNIYILFNTIYRQKRKNILIAYDLFNELCMPINKCFFDQYIYDSLEYDEYYMKFQYVHMYHDYINDEESKMIINNSHILIRSNKIDNVFINNIIDLNNLFICDFKNDYYILSGVSKSLGKTK